MGTPGYDRSYLICLSLKIILKIQDQIKYIEEVCGFSYVECYLYVACNVSALSSRAGQGNIDLCC